MLSAPGLRFHRALAPFLLRVVGSAHPDVGGVLGYTPFFIVVFLSSCVAFYFIIFLGCACPCLPSVPRVGFSPGVTQDVSCESVPHAWVPLLDMSGLVYYLQRSFDIYLLSIQ